MSLTNEELRDDGSSISARVKRLFGIAPPVIVRAVVNFLQQEPGELDHHGLRAIAAATKAIDDPQLVALLVRDMPVTHMHLSAEPIDLQVASQQFVSVLKRYPRLVRQRLVGDLVRMSALVTIASVPVNRVSDVGAELVRTYYRGLLDKSILDMAGAIGDRSCTGEMIDAVLDEVERRIDKSEHGTSTRAPHKMPLAAVGDAFAAILESGSEVVSPRHVDRTWALMQRCDQDEQWTEWILAVALRRADVMQRHAASALEMIGALSPESRRREFRGMLLCNPYVPEVVARRAALDGVVVAEHFKDMLRMITLRAWTYMPGAGNGELLPDGLSSAEIDRRLAELPGVALTAEVIDQMENASALGRLCERSDVLDSSALLALMRHPAIDFDEAHSAVAHKIVSMSGTPDNLVYTDDEVESSMLGNLLLLRGDVPMSAATKMIAVTPVDQRKHFLDCAARNPKLTHLVLDLMTRDLQDMPTAHDQRLLYQRHMQSTVRVLGGVALDARAHERLFELAVFFGDDKAMRVLAANAMVHPDVLRMIDEKFDSIGTVPPKIIASSYGPEDVARKIVEGVASRRAVDALIDGCKTDVTDDAGSATSLARHREAIHRALETVIEQGMLSDAQWRALTSVSDYHFSLRYAADPRCPVSASSFIPETAMRLSNTTYAMENQLGAWPTARPSVCWNDLPNRRDEELPRTSVSDLIDGRVVAGLELTTPRTQRELENAAKRMGNCIAGYVDAVREGSAVVAWTRRGTNMLAAVWTVEDKGRLQLYEVNSAFNMDDVPVELKKGLANLTGVVNRLEEERATREQRRSAVRQDKNDRDHEALFSAPWLMDDAAEGDPVVWNLHDVHGWQALDPSVHHRLDATESAHASVVSHRGDDALAVSSESGHVIDLSKPTKSAPKRDKALVLPQVATTEDGEAQLDPQRQATGAQAPSALTRSVDGDYLFDDGASRGEIGLEARSNSPAASLEM